MNIAKMQLKDGPKFNLLWIAIMGVFNKASSDLRNFDRTLVIKKKASSIKLIIIIVLPRILQ